MDEEILDALTKANAVDQESGLTIGKLMELTGKELDAVVSRVRSMRRDQKVRVSNENHLADNAQYAWPVTHGLEVSSTAVAAAKREHKERIHPPIVVWLGHSLVKEMEEKKEASDRLERLLEVMSTPRVSVHGDNYGQIAAGDGNKQEQRSSVQTLRDTASSSPLTQNPIQAPSSPTTQRSLLEYAYWVGGIVVAILAVIAWLNSGK